jgi:chemotaxis protein MotB
VSGDHASHDDDEIHEEHEEHANHEAWVIPYADLLTLLMAMFIALFAISTVNVDKAKRLALGFNNASSRPLDGLFGSSPGKSPVPGVGDNQTGGSGVLGGGNKPDQQTQAGGSSSQITASTAIQKAEKKERTSFWHLQHTIQKVANAQGVGNEISFQLEGRGLVVRLVNDNVLFASGQANIEPEGQHVLQVVGAVLAHIKNPLLIEGYTDDRPINTAQYASNWELSTARADVVLRYLVDAMQLDEARMTAQGYGARNPVDSNATDAGRAKNRRVEIVIESTVIQQILEANNLTNAAINGFGASSTPSSTTTTKPDLSNVVGKLGVGN